jgi:hypothetical protein
MHEFTNSERLSSALVRSMEHRRASRRPLSDDATQAPCPLTIAFSREVGSHGDAVARAVGRRLEWEVFDHELLELIAGDLKVRVKLLEDVDERHVSWLQETIESICAVGAIREGTYVKHLVEAILSLAARGRCVIVGRGASLILPAGTTLRVRAIAPLADRIATIARDRGLSRQEAAAHLAQKDRERMEFLRQHFPHDPSDAAHFDLVVNTAELPVEECATVVIDALHGKQHARGAMAQA